MSGGVIKAIRYVADCRGCGRERIKSVPVPVDGAMNGDRAGRVRCAARGTTNYTKDKESV